MTRTARPLADVAGDIASSLHRRSLLRALAALPAATGAALLDGYPTAAAAPAIATAPDDADRQLAALADCWNAAQSAFNQAFNDECAAAERMADVERPPALNLAPGDRWIFVPRRVNEIGLREVEEIRCQLLREDEEAADDADYAQTSPARAHRRRMIEILDAWDGWQAAQEREAERSGYNAAVERRIAAGQLVAALRAAIVDAPATTPLGLLLKIGIATDGFADDVIAEALDRERSPDGASAAAVLVSVMRDWRALFPAAAALT